MESIIVVDDDRNIRQTIIDILSFEDMVAEPFSSAEGVLARIVQGGIGLVITDLNMPGMDGIELISSIKNTLDAPFCNTPVIMLTGAGHDSRANEALEKGACGCLGKPFDIDEFLDLVRGTLEGESS